MTHGDDVTARDRCVESAYTSPTGTVRVDFESSPNERRVVTDLPFQLIDDDVTLVKLDSVTVSILRCCVLR